MRPAARVSARPSRSILALGLFGASFFAVPFVALVAKAPWLSLPEFVGDDAVQSALWLSVVTSLITTLLAVLLGVPLAWVLARSEIPGRRWLRALCTLSMVLPPVVGGVALSLALGRRGIVGGPLYDLLGVSVPFTT